MKLILVGRMVLVTISLVGFSVSLSLAAQAGALLRGDGGAQYPNSQRLSATQFGLDARAKPDLGQSSLYRSPDAAAQVFEWYAQTWGVNPATAGALDNCQTFTTRRDTLMVRYMLAVTLCSQPHGTLIYVNRSLGLR